MTRKTRLADPSHPFPSLRYTLHTYWEPTFKKQNWSMLESLALEEPPPRAYVPLLGAYTLVAASPILLLCSIQ
jgi:hypothetical protein